MGSARTPQGEGGEKEGSQENFARGFFFFVDKLLSFDSSHDFLVFVFFFFFEWEKLDPMVLPPPFSSRPHVSAALFSSTSFL